MQQRHERLEALSQYLGSDQYVEGVAREQLGLVREGETSIVVISTAPSATLVQDQPERDELWWQNLIR
jgi:cell division protein FtsB